MVLLVCDKCNYSTNKYQHIVRHLNNKFPCINQIVYVNKKMIELAKKRPLKEVIEIFSNMEVDEDNSDSDNPTTDDSFLRN
jgi:hypothetical protein